MNLIEAMKLLFPQQVAMAVAFARPRTIRRRVIQTAGRFVRHAGKLMLVLGASTAALFQAALTAAPHVVG